MKNKIEFSAEMARDWLAQRLDNVFFAEQLFDLMSDVVFFVKDSQGRYVVVNQTLMRRCGLREKATLLGRTASEVFPPSLAASYAAQDVRILKLGAELRDQLELHIYPNRKPGWCLTQKIALRDKHQQIIGMCGISRDIAAPDKQHPVYAKIAAAVDYLHQHTTKPIAMQELVALTGLSVAQLERHFRKVYSITPRQMMLKMRLEAAAQLLIESQDSITDIALACGYQDHSAFSRVFKATVGMRPSQYREVMCKSL